MAGLACGQTIRVSLSVWAHVVSYGVITHIAPKYVADTVQP